MNNKIDNIMNKYYGTSLNNHNKKVNNNKFNINSYIQSYAEAYTIDYEYKSDLLNNQLKIDNMIKQGYSEGEIIDKIKSAGKATWEFIKELIKKIKNFIVNIWNKIFNRKKEQMKELQKEANDVVSKVKEKVKNEDVDDNTRKVMSNINRSTDALDDTVEEYSKKPGNRIIKEYAILISGACTNIQNYLGKLQPGKLNIFDNFSVEVPTKILDPSSIIEQIPKHDFSKRSSEIFFIYFKFILDTFYTDLNIKPISYYSKKDIELFYDLYGGPGKMIDENSMNLLNGITSKDSNVFKVNYDTTLKNFRNI